MTAVATWIKQVRRGLAAAVVTLVCLAFAAAAVAWPLSHRMAVAVIAYGPGGRPIAAFACKGSFHLLITNVPTGPLTAWSVDAQRSSIQSFEDRRDDVIRSADRHFGETIVPPPRPLPMAGASPSVVHNRFRLALGGGRPVMGMPGTWFAYASAPAWLVVAPLAVLPACVGPGWRRRRRWARTGACLGRGYDLRQSPDRCPECGRPASRRSATS